jgi:8-oxo-dGTP pyrophosphatase MutT (NUDIX family)
MQLVFADDVLPTQVYKTIFLAGPNPRYKDGDVVEETWRHKAIQYLEDMNYTGHVFIPLPKRCFHLGGIVSNPVTDYNHQVEWEDKAMARADILLFYVDRRNGLQGLTTNIEFGRYLDSGRMVYARPNDAENIRYLDEQVRNRGGIVYEDNNSPTAGEWSCALKQALYKTVQRLGDGALRVRGDVNVPLLFWKSPQFQDWYANMCGDEDMGGNRLLSFQTKAVITFNNDTFLFGFAAHVNIWIASEGREKSNEWIFSRTYTSYVVPYFIDAFGVRQYVLVREFRSPANNPKAYVYELPGGSSTDGKKVSPYENAQKELEEETGIIIEDITRFRFLGNRQTFATFSTNKIFAVDIQLTEEEFEGAKKRAQEKTILGENDGERIRLFIVSEEQLIEHYEDFPADYTTLGILHISNNLSGNHNDQFEQLIRLIQRSCSTNCHDDLFNLCFEKQETLHNCTFNDIKILTDNGLVYRRYADDTIFDLSPTGKKVVEKWTDRLNINPFTNQDEDE